MEETKVQETEVTDRVVWKSIQEAPEQWANQVLVFYHSLKDQQPEDSYDEHKVAEARQKYADQVGQAGFDVKVQAAWLQEMYRNIKRERA